MSQVCNVRASALAFQIFGRSIAYMHFPPSPCSCSLIIRVIYNPEDFMDDDEDSDSDSD